ncbi:MAG: ABC transporter ATP-binding protein [Microthrixaceae bacterium]|jgi:ABC-2 type transport system ATP-binding protein|nr:ABC transporter ATP-binding protein [Actinomycetota bacterium]MBP6729061.1 ABC transporter ATP-binding protein [Microthrixaceae bacterium]HMS12659.1 ABC transporter ATP-binding protein [Microthrixaceae bacterium]HMT24309.1 ABC transporter ATP-binding protein [Microthrixaceae bacterium]HMT60358.1 ABC transporter ATP-binding protein [Microthrixaceae bacterium]
MTDGRELPGDDRAVVVRHLVKRFGAKVAVADVNIDVPRGSFYGVVGPNGAGKSTTLKMCTCLLEPDHGDIWIDGHHVWSDPRAAKTRFGALPDDLPLFERLTGREFLEFVGVFRGLASDLVLDRSGELLEVLGLSDAGNVLVADYSTGMRKKIGLAAAILHAPRVLFLDEPFESVDPVSARSIQTVLERFCGAGGTVVWSSHVMDTVERLCDQVAIVHDGRVVAAGPIEQVRAGRRLEDVFIDAVGGLTDASSTLSWLNRSDAGEAADGA